MRAVSLHENAKIVAFYFNNAVLNNDRIVFLLVSFDSRRTVLGDHKTIFFQKSSVSMYFTVKYETL